MSNYPPGVTGSEYQIAGPDYEQEFHKYPCPECKGKLIEQGYKREKWIMLICMDCGFFEDLDVDYDKPDDRR